MPCTEQVVDEVPQLVSMCFGPLQALAGERACLYMLPAIAQDGFEEAIDDFPPPLLILSIAGGAFEPEQTTQGSRNFTQGKACASLTEATTTLGTLRVIARTCICEQVPACKACAISRRRTDYSSLAAALLSAFVAHKRERA